MAGVDIQLTATKGHSARTFRQAAILTVAVTKLLKRPACKDFADSDLGDFLDEIFGMGQLAMGLSPCPGMHLGDPLGARSTSIPLNISLPTEPVPFQRVEDSYSGAPGYRYTRSQSFDILDIDQKCFVLESPTQLVALHLQGPSARRKGEGAWSQTNIPNPRATQSHLAALGPPVHPSLLSAVRLNIALYRPRLSQGGQGTGRVPVALGIKGYQLYMSCVMSGAEPVLQLEVSGDLAGPTPSGAGGPFPLDSSFHPSP